MKQMNATPPQLELSVRQLSALAHEGRLTLMKRLIQAGAEGESAGDLARFAGVNPPTVSARLLVLTNAGLAYSRRDGRQIIYYAGYDAMRLLLGFLLQDCCCGHRDICEPLLRASP